MRSPPQPADAERYPCHTGQRNSHPTGDALMFTRALSFFAAAVFSLSALAAGPEAFEGHDYTRLKQAQPVATGKKIEVLEFFWYRCPHCFQLAPGLNTWLKTLP